MGFSGERLFFSKPPDSAVLVFIASLVLYSCTLAPTVTLVDSGELIVAARSVGVSHPPGFPLYLILAHVASVVPIGSVAQRVNFASALFAAVACGILTLVVAELLQLRKTNAALRWRGNKPRRKEKRSRQPDAELKGESSPLSILVSAVAGGLLFASTHTLWAYATITEVYTLNSLILLAVFFLMLRWRRRVLESRGFATRAPSGENTQRDWLLYLAAVLFGLGLGVHHVTVALTLPALAALVYQTEGAKFFRGKRFIFAALCAIGALLVVYSYLPLAAARDPIMNWGNPRSFSAIWAHITGRQYQVFLSFSPGNIGAQLPQFAALLLREFGPLRFPLALCFAIVGIAAVFKRDRPTFFFLLFIVLADVAYVLNYDIAEDKDAYYLPTFIAVAIATGLGLHRLLQLSSQKFNRRRAYLVMAPAILLLPGLALASNWPSNSRRHYFIAQDYVENILRTVEPNGLLLTLDWQVASPMLYSREIERRRPGVQTIDVQLLRRSWYFDYLKRAYPDLFERSREKIDIYLGELKRWERDPSAYAKNPTLTQNIVSKFLAMCESLVTRQLEVAPVYVTTDLLLLNQGPHTDFTNWLKSNYQAVPRGLIFQLSADQDFHDPGPLQLKTRGLADGTIRFEPDDVVTLKVLPVYKTMLVNRGRYFAHFGQHASAIEAFAQALALDPTFDLALEGMKQSMAEREKSGQSQP
jgi:tetratricopeptide (TPR) repeat protein